MLFNQWMADGHKFAIMFDAQDKGIVTDGMQLSGRIMMGADVPNEGVGQNNEFFWGELYWEGQCRGVQIPWSAVRNMFIAAARPGAASDAPASQSMQ